MGAGRDPRAVARPRPPPGLPTRARCVCSRRTRRPRPSAPASTWPRCTACWKHRTTLSRMLLRTRSAVQDGRNLEAAAGTALSAAAIVGPPWS